MRVTTSGHISRDAGTKGAKAEPAQREASVGSPASPHGAKPAVSSSARTSPMAAR